MLLSSVIRMEDCISRYLLYFTCLLGGRVLQCPALVWYRRLSYSCRDNVTAAAVFWFEWLG